MKIRQPKTDGLDLTPKLNSPWKSISYQIKTITPLYGGGVEAGAVDMAMPIRAAAIRGQLRYWWRFLQANRSDGQQLEGKALYEAERAIWGGLNENTEQSGDKDGNAAGKVSVAVEVTEKTDKVDAESFSERHRPGINYALFSAKQDKQDLYAEGIKFSLMLRAREKESEHHTKHCGRGLTKKQWEEVQQAVRWWANFGGVGARTRRGLGAVEVAEIKRLTEEEVNAYGCSLHTLKPVSGHATKGGATKSGAIQAWAQAMDKLFQFRQGRGVGRETGTSQPGRSYWPEPDTIREITKRIGHPIQHGAVGSFPRAMFGLPIIYEISGSGEPPKTHLLPDRADSSRMASPLIIKPVADGKGNCIPSVLCLPIKHLTELNLKLEVDKKNEEKQKLSKDILGDFPKKITRSDSSPNAWWPVNEEQQQARADTIKPMKGGAPDPLQAFLEFFAGKRNSRAE